MNKKIIVAIIIVAVILVMGLVLLNKPKPQISNNPSANEVKTSQPNQTSPTAPIKEFIMQSFVEMIDGQPKPQYSLKEITVKKGDLVRIKITVTSGNHDFKIDEYNIYADTQLNQEYTVEFIADKAGEFIYYCTKPGHRANGHWGTLKVLE